MNTIVERKLFFAWNMAKEKNYLEQKAREGLHLKKVTLGRYEFVQGEPEDVVYQFDFQMHNKQTEKEYLELFQDWDLVLRYGGWYYFKKTRDGENDQIFSDVDSIKKLYLRLIVFIALCGFPLYYQTLIMFPNLVENDSLSTFYLYFRPFVYGLTLIHAFALFRLIRVLISLNKEVIE